MAVFGGSFIGLMLLPANFPYLAFALLIAANGIGSGMFASPNSSSIMGSVPAHLRTDSAACPAATRRARWHPSTRPQVNGCATCTFFCAGCHNHDTSQPGQLPGQRSAAGPDRPPLVPECGGPFLRVRAVVDRRPDPLGIVEDVGPG